MQQNTFWLQLKRVPTPLALVVGLLLGLLIGKTLPTSLLSTGGNNPIFVSRLSARKQITLPSIDQRRRVLDLLSTLSPHHTTECTRNSQPLYVQQVRDRYDSLIGHKTPSESTWFSSWGFSDSQHVHNVPKKEHKYFFAINLYNSFDVIPDLFATLFRVSAILGYHNVYVSIYENGSTDQTKALLRIFDALTRSVGLRVTIRTSTRTRGAFNHRIEYLAEVRNQAFNPLHELRDSHNEYFDTIIFMNDILHARRNNAGITCASDYMYHQELASPVFYDNWVARDINGTALENAPFESMHLPIQVQSCWNGVAVLDPAPFYTPPYIKFRMARLTDDECSASECSLICNDYWEAGYGRILMVPRVKLAYDKRVFDIIHPSRRNLTAIRGYMRLGGLPDNPRTDPQDRSWFGPHDRLFTPEESEEIDFVPGPSHVWCWGWDGAGDIDGPDVDPIWEYMPDRSQHVDSVKVKHHREMSEL
ncbi:glycosyltransferase family 69 protein [Suillus subaureus]|uniref:Glycosyltransferase family 69 protein n=1 Tax=Suillus subaureus TaxID=48587 RepID=A0A9P7DX65_9AGAM|nr:glycosyltransferase family 69 protein [Suillus subaureus]KAG1805481.1 glycosyltransferase family 69 protein [Suillus subaureus]